MDGNKDEALKSLKIAESALKSNDKTRALKFLKIAKRLDPNLKIDHISLSPKSPKIPNPQIPPSNHPKSNPNSNPKSEPSSQSYTEENLKSIREIRKNKDYYAILGLQKTSTNEEIKKAYKKLSLKIHPDKNKAPGAEEAFKSLSKAFNCLNNEQSRLNYDQTGSENYDFALQNDDNFTHRRATRRRYYSNGFYEEGFDDNDEIFRSFFFGSQERVNRTRNFNNRQRNYRNTPQNQNPNMAEVQNTVILVILVCILFFFLVASLPFLESEYSLQKSQTYQIGKNIEGFNVEYFVKREDFEARFPKGGRERANLEAQVLRDFKGLIGRYCHAEMQRKFWDSSYATPSCDRLRSFQTV
ncbi:hypothetical protein LUZ60_003557 [Juncus effusus]|nr:hypothetical protein LUZ60_003557 [Juncus effusus]